MRESTLSIIKATLDPFVGMYTPRFNQYLSDIGDLIDAWKVAAASGGVQVFFANVNLQQAARRINTYAAPEYPYQPEQLTSIWTSILTAAAAAYGER